MLTKTAALESGPHSQRVVMQSGRVKAHVSARHLLPVITLLSTIMRRVYPQPGIWHLLRPLLSRFVFAVVGLIMSLPSAYVRAQVNESVDTSSSVGSPVGANIRAGIVSDATCMSRLDTAAEQLSRAQTQAAEAELLELLTVCPDTPQVQHNLAVVEARRGEWDEAMSLLLESIALDARASASIESLRDIHRWRASEAYARALTGKVAPQTPPELAVQSSVDVNSDTRRSERRDESLFDTATVEYELWEWWRSAQNPASDQHQEHYSADYDGADLLAPTVNNAVAQTVPDWDSVSRDIRVMGDNALALISWTTDDVGASTNDSPPLGHVLLMRVEGNRWRIHETLPLP